MKVLVFIIITVAFFLISCSQGRQPMRETTYPQEDSGNGEILSQNTGTTSRFVAYDTPPAIIRAVNPVTPRQILSGTVVLEVEALRDGSVGEIDVVESLLAGKGGHDEAAVKALRQWKFRPALSNGSPVAVWMRIPIEFRQVERN